MLKLLLSAFCLGVVFCAPPGAVNTETLRRGIKRGYPAALTVQIGSLIGDASWAVLGLSGADIIIHRPGLSTALQVFAVVLLIYLSFGAMCDAWTGVSLAASTEGGVEMEKRIGAGDFLAGALLSLTSPTSLIYWLALGGSLSVVGISSPHASDYALFLCGFLLGCLLWCVVFSCVVAWGRRLLSPLAVRIVNVICGIILGAAAIAVAKMVLARVL